MNSEKNNVLYWDRLRTQTKEINKADKRRGTLLLMPNIDPDVATFPRISAERHARIPAFQYFLKYIRAVKEDKDV